MPAPALEQPHCVFSLRPFHDRFQPPSSCRKVQQFFADRHPCREGLPFSVPVFAQAPATHSPLPGLVDCVSSFNFSHRMTARFPSDERHCSTNFLVFFRYLHQHFPFEALRKIDFFFNM
jgi:hypothetical protein